VAAIGVLGVLLEGPGRGVDGIHLVQGPVVLREDHDVRLIGAVDPEIVKAARAEPPIGRHRAGRVHAGQGAALDQGDQLVGDVGLVERAGHGPRAGDPRVDQRVTIFIEERIASGTDAKGRPLRRGDRPELSVGRARYGTSVGAKRRLVVRIDLAVIQREQEVGAIEEPLVRQRR